jgi:ubiquinone/menaquinone biosynthesis methyltransferase
MTDGRVPLRDAFESPQTRRRHVRELFSTIADRYDLITVLLSFGLDRRWKERVIRRARPRSGSRALDLACGTGDIAFGLADAGAHVTGLDVTYRMVQLARHKRRAASPAFLQGDMMSLPFGDAQFDIVTAGYGLRNVPELLPALDEIRRVLKPGGAFVSLDFNRPSNLLVRTVYLAYLTGVGSALGWTLHRDPDTYRYIPESIKRYPGAPMVTRLMLDRGFSEARWERVLGGLMAIHVATRSAAH